MTATLVASPVVGFRAWSVWYGGFLRPQNPHCGHVELQEAWLAGTARARCWDEGPCSNFFTCSCGLYAEKAPVQRAELCGAVVAWGRIIEHEHGFRAEYMRPVAFSSDSPGLPASYLRDASERYSIPVVSPEELVPYALFFGDGFGTIASEEERP